jgi:hypothetical protein
MTQDQSLSESFETIFNFFLAGLNINCPGIIQSYDTNRNLCNVQPVFKRAFIDIDGVKQEIEPPVIPNVPVMFLSGGGAFIKTPDPVKGDSVLLLFSQRSLDTFLETDGKTIIDPKDFRMFDITDAVALVGLTTVRNKFTNTHPANITLGFNSGKKLHLTPGSSGKLWTDAARTNLGNENADKALALAEKVNERMTDIENALKEHTHIGNLGYNTSPPVTPVITNGSDTDSTKVFTDG